MDTSKAVEEITSSMMSCSMDCECCENTKAETPPTPAESSLPERVLDLHVDENGNKFYLVKWFGFPVAETTWESESHLNEIATLNPHILDDYNKKLEQEKNQESQNQEFLIPDPNYYVPDQAMAVCVDFEPSNNGYVFASTPEEIVGVIDRGDDHDFLVKWYGMESVEVVPRRVANQMWPEMVIKYYEDNLVWKSAADGQEH